jgi:hypothetical protein
MMALGASASQCCKRSEIGTRHAMVRTVFATEPFLAYVFPSFLSVPCHHALLPDLRLVFDACEMDRDLATFENEGIVYTNVSLVCCNCRLEENGVASFDEAICRLQSQLSERIKDIYEIAASKRHDL